MWEFFCSFSPLTRGIFLCFLHHLSVMHAKLSFVARIKRLSFSSLSLRLKIKGKDCKHNEDVAGRVQFSFWSSCNPIKFSFITFRQMMLMKSWAFIFQLQLLSLFLTPLLSFHWLLCLFSQPCLCFEFSLKIIFALHWNGISIALCAENE